MKVFSRDKFIQHDIKGNYERNSYIKEWVDTCHGLSYEEIEKLGYEVLDEDMVDVEDLLIENQQLKDKLKGVQEERDYLFNKQSIENKYLTEENKQLKIDYELYKDNCVYRNYEVEIRDNTIKQLKEVIEEVREYIKNKGSYVDSYDGQTIFYLGEENQIELLQILDKVKGE